MSKYGTDRYKRPYPVSPAEERARQKTREEHAQKMVNDLWRTLPQSGHQTTSRDTAQFPEEPQENILYFIEKFAPLLEPWEREVVRIVRKLAQYFYPQRQTQVMNEGWATFWHYTLLYELYDRRRVTDGFMMEFLQSHTSVINQPGFDSPHYSGINPYALGFAMMRDIRRICEDPTEEDRRWFPEIAGGSWQDTLQFAMRNFKDESFILQYLSPSVMRDLRLFSIEDDDSRDYVRINAIHDDEGYRMVRENLSRQYNPGVQEPNIQVVNADIKGDRTLTLIHQQADRTPLHEQTQKVMQHIKNLWGFDVVLSSVSGNIEIARWEQ